MGITGPPLIGHKYRVVTKLGHGSAADVYLGFSEGLNGFAKLAVVKVLQSHLAADPDLSARFVQEARLSMRLAHPNFVQTYEAQEVDDTAYIAMEFLHGQPLSAILNRLGRDSDQFDFACQLVVLIEVLAAMEHAHQLADYDGTQLDVVHRDLSPPNIFVTYDGQVKVLDFGIAKALDSSVETRAGIILGKATYVSPEQALGRDVDARADLYSLGVILWEAAAGRRRWPGHTGTDIVAQIVSDDVIELPCATERGLPPEVDEIVARALARVPADRFQTAAEFRIELERVLEKMGRHVELKDIGRMVSEAFASERVRREREVESFSQLHYHPEHIARFVPSDDWERNDDSISPVTTAHLDVLSLQHKLAIGRRLWTAGLVLVVALVSTLGILHFAASRRSHAVATPVPLEYVTLRIRVTPSSAELWLDGQPLASNPALVQRARDDTVHTLRAVLPGYRPLERQVQFQTSLDFSASLQRLTTATSSSAPSVLPSGPPPVPKRTPEVEQRMPRRAHAPLTKHSASAATSPAPKPAGSSAAPVPLSLARTRRIPVSAAPAPSASSAKKPNAPRVKLDTSNPWQ